MDIDAAPTRLTPELLERFLDLLRQQGHPFPEKLNPGLTDDEIDALTAPLGISLPDEARVLWRWHDGAVTREGDERSEFGFGPHWSFSPLAVTVRWCQFQRSVSQDPDSYFPWRPEWFPIIMSEVDVVGDTSVDRAALVPIRMIDPLNEQWPEQPDLPSLGSVFELFVRAIEERVWIFDPDRGYTLVDREPHDPEDWPYGMP